jgi:prevent-host-death family protein
MTYLTGHDEDMQEVSIAEAKSRFSHLLERAAEGEEIVITRRGEPIAMLTRAPASRQKPRLGTMAGTFVLPKGWDTAMTDEEFVEFANHGDF